MISLFKAVYNYNQSLRAKSINCAKVVLYIRSDIIKAMASRDAESARWDDYRFDLDWSVNSIKDIYQADLYKMVKKRIDVSCPEAKNMTFDEIFAPERDLEIELRGLDFFKVLVLQTLFRPRDLIKLLKTLQSYIVKKRKINCEVYNETLKKYSNWLVNTEIANEINPVLKDDYLYVIELLRLCGSRNLTVKSFSGRYYSVKHTFNMQPLDMLNYLYSVGIIENSWKNKTLGKYMHRSIFRNEGDFDRNLEFRIIPTVWNGLTV